MRSEIQRLRQQLRDSEERFTSTKLQLADAQEAAAAAQRHATAATYDLDERRTEIESHLGQIEQLNERILELTAERDARDERIVSLEANLSRAMDRVSLLEGSVEQSRQTSAATDSRLASADERIDRLRAELRDARETARTATRESERIRAENSML